MSTTNTPSLCDLVSLWLTEEKFTGLSCNENGVVRRARDNAVLCLIYETFAYYGFQNPGDLGIVEAADPLFFDKLRKVIEK